jgi:hypothetical protein
MADGARNTGMVTLVARPHPFDSDTVYAEAKAGQTIAQLLGNGASHSLRVEVGGIEVPATLWHHVRPKAGQRLTITAFPQGGGNSNKLLKLVVLIVAVVLVYFQMYQAAGYVLSLGFTAINILVPPPQPKLPGAGASFDPLLALTGTQNNAAVYSPIPMVIGTVRFFPTHAALPYTEISGNDQWLRMMLDLGPGDLDISDIQIGSTPIGSYSDVQWEVTHTPTLYTNDIYELQVAAALNTAGNTGLRTSQTNSSELSVDVQFPSGLFGVDNKGNNITGHVGVTIQYRLTGTTTWSNAAVATGLSPSSGQIASDGVSAFTISSSVRKAVRVGVRWQVPAGQYDVQITRGSTWWDATTSTNYADMTWTVLRSISAQNPSTTGTLKLCIRIKATDQLNSVVSTVSVLGSQRIRTYDPGTGLWTTSVATSNNAWVYHWLLTACPGVARLIDTARVDIDAIVAWAADCDAMGYTYNQLEQSGRTLFALLGDVLASGRATFGMRNGKYACVRDVVQTTPVQMFTPYNSWQFSGQRAFYNAPHALRCQWINPTASNQQDELVVYADGYSADGSGGTTLATLYEVMDLRMCTDPLPVWRIGSYHLAAAAQRPNTYTWMADVENLVCERGDLVRVAHDVVEWGVGSGRIKSISGDRLSVTLDGAMPLLTGQLYAIEVRQNDGVQQVINTTTTGNGDVQVFAFASAIPSTILPGDLCVIGERSLGTRDIIVQMIEPMQDLTARLTGVDAAPTVPAAGTGTPPPFVSAITGTPWCSAPAVPVVSIRSGDSAPDDAGVIHAVQGVSGAPTPGILRVPIYGGGGCVVVESVLPDGRGAGTIAVGDAMQLADEVTLAGRTGTVSYSQPLLQPCVEIMTERGVVLRCSISAPIATDRGCITAPNLAGRRVAVLIDGVAGWDRVLHIRTIGQRMVQHLTCEDSCFWAGAAGSAGYLLHHNKQARQDNR